MAKSKIFVILITLLIAELVGVIYYLTRPLPIPRPVSSEVEGGAVLSLSPDSGQITAGETVFVKINLDTGGQATDGTRAVLRFDPSLLQVEDVNYEIAVYANYPVKKIDNETGRVVVSGIINPNEDPFQGQGVLATLKVKGLKAGWAALSFDFTPGETTDSNVALTKSGEDLLVKTAGAVYTVDEL